MRCKDIIIGDQGEDDDDRDDHNDDDDHDHDHDDIDDHDDHNDNDDQHDYYDDKHDDHKCKHDSNLLSISLDSLKRAGFKNNNDVKGKQFQDDSDIRAVE